MSSKIIEVEEKTIDGAIEKACREFGVPREKLNIEIISEGSNGFLGIMAKKAKIKASLLSLDMDFPLSLKPETTRSKATINIDPPPVKIAPAGKTNREKPQTLPAPRPSPAPRISSAPRTSPEPSSITIAPVIAAPTAITPIPSAITPAPAKAPAPVVYIAKSPLADQGKELLEGILKRMSFECSVNAAETEDSIILSISGDASGLLIGRRGQTLDALQYLLNKSINKADNERKMIVVDSEDYRMRRQESLLGLAQKIRDKVKKTQKPLSLSHMNAHDRRVIHLALQDDETLITRSRGEGEYRKIIVLPARKNNNGNARARTRQ